VLYSVDSTASQHPATASLQLQDIEDTGSSYSAFTWMMLHLTVRTWTWSIYRKFEI